MKVLHVYKTYRPDNFQGIPRAIWEIAESTRHLGVTSEVLSLSPSPHPPTVPVDNHLSHRVRQDLFLASTSLSWSAFSRFHELSAQADVVHYHYPWPLMDLLALSARDPRPAIVTYHSDVVRQRVLRVLYGPLMHAFLRRANRIVATSPNYVETSPVLCRYLSKVEVIPLSLEDRAPVAAERLEHWRHRFPQPFLLFVGALRYYKGLPFLVEAARRTQTPVVIAGTGELSKELARSRPPWMTLLGEIADEDREALLSLCRAFVFPSHLRAEAFGVALLEAARAGKPMISCEIGTGTSYVNISGETGITVSPGNVDQLSEAMAAMMSDAPVEQMGRAARLRYETLFTPGATAQAYVKLYDSAQARQGQMTTHEIAQHPFPSR